MERVNATTVVLQPAARDDSLPNSVADTVAK